LSWFNLISRFFPILYAAFFTLIFLSVSIFYIKNCLTSPHVYSEALSFSFISSKKIRLFSMTLYKLYFKNRLYLFISLILGFQIPLLVLSFVSLFRYIISFTIKNYCQKRHLLLGKSSLTQILCFQVHWHFCLTLYIYFVV
jgi:hypothetical protein